MIDFKAFVKGVKWTAVGVAVLSGWIAAAWIKADLRPEIIQPLPTPIRYEIVAQKPTSGQEWAIYEGAKVRFLQNSQRDGSEQSERSRKRDQNGDVDQSQSANAGMIDSSEHLKSPNPLGGVLPLGRFLVPTGGRDPVYVTPELDTVSGETKLQVQPAGGFARFGGERYAFVDLSYVNQLQGFQDAASSPSLDIGLHQDLGRLGKLELMAEGWLGASLLSVDNQTQSVLSVGVKVRVALPF